MNNDINFVNSLYGQATEKPSKKMDSVFFIILLFLVSAVTWASFAKIDELTRGVGKVVPANKIQTIQSLDGGIISDILIRDGDTVKIGQALMKIDTTRFKASLEENQEKFLSLTARKARLTSQIKYIADNKIPKIKYPSILKNGKNNYTNTENKVFKNKIAQYNSSIKTLQYQLYQKRQELKEIVSKESQLRESLHLLNNKNTL